MKKRLLVTLLICILAVSTLIAMGKPEVSTTTTNTTTVAKTEKVSNFKRGVTYKLENDDIGSFSVTFYDDGTCFFIDYDDSRESSEIDYYLVGNDIYAYLGYEGYTKIGSVADDEKTITIKNYRYYKNYDLTLNRVY